MGVCQQTRGKKLIYKKRQGDMKLAFPNTAEDDTLPLKASPGGSWETAGR